jgi:hypothetical protein
MLPLPELREHERRLVATNPIPVLQVSSFPRGYSPPGTLPANFFSRVDK